MSIISSFKRYTDANSFLNECSKFLYSYEIENNIIIGVVNQLKSQDTNSDIYLGSSSLDGSIDGAFLMTPPHRLSIAANSSNKAIDLLIENLKSLNILIPGIIGLKQETQYFIRLWNSIVPIVVQQNKKLLCYKLNSVKHFSQAEGKFSLAEVEDQNLIVEYLTNFHQETGAISTTGEALVQKVSTGIAQKNKYYTWKNKEELLAIAVIVRQTQNFSVIGGVYTPKKHRGLGYASSIVSELSKLKLAQGNKYCCLFADSANHTSNKIYQNIGYAYSYELYEYDFKFET